MLFRSRSLADASAEDLTGDHQVFGGRAEEMPAAFRERFDVAFSVAAFEHMDRLPLTLDAAYDALVPGGCLFSLFSPIWSAHDGHHLPNIRDRSGREFSFASSPIPPWGHLLARPLELFAYLLQHTDRETAADMVYHVYHSGQINRLFTEDYLAYCASSRFAVERADPVFPLPPPAEIQTELERRYPGRRQFANNGLLLILRKGAKDRP